MTNDVENLVLVQLREIRGRLDQIDAKLGAHDRRFDKIDERFDALDFKLTNALGFAAMANLGAQHPEIRVSEVAERQRRMEAEMSEFDRRLKKVEHPAGEH